MTNLPLQLPSWLQSDLLRLAVTFALALASGWTLMQIGAPAP